MENRQDIHDRSQTTTDTGSDDRENRQDIRTDTRENSVDTMTDKRRIFGRPLQMIEQRGHQEGREGAQRGHQDRC